MSAVSARPFVARLSLPIPGHSLGCHARPFEKFVPDTDTDLSHWAKERKYDFYPDELSTNITTCKHKMYIFSIFFATCIVGLKSGKKSI